MFESSACQVLTMPAIAVPCLVDLHCKMLSRLGGQRSLDTKYRACWSNDLGRYAYREGHKRSCLCCHDVFANLPIPGPIVARFPIAMFSGLIVATISSQLKALLCHQLLCSNRNMFNYLPFFDLGE